MPTRTFTAPESGPLTARITAEALELQVTVDAGIETATMTLSGPAEVVDHAEDSMSGNTWSLRVPAPASSSVTRVGGGQTVVMNAGVVTGTVTGMVISNNVAGNTIISSGDNVVVNGRRITGADLGGEPVRAQLRLPAGAQLLSEVTAGRVGIQGDALARVDHDSTSADLEVEAAADLVATTISGDVCVRALSGPARVKTTSGDTTATTTGPISIASVSGDITLTADGVAHASTTSGDIRIHARSDEAGAASSVSGDITITGATGITPQIDTSTVSGRIRR